MSSNTSSKSDKNKTADQPRQFDRNEWIARAVAAAAMKPAKPAPAASKKEDVKKD